MGVGMGREKEGERKEGGGSPREALEPDEFETE